MMNTPSEKELMRECIAIDVLDDQIGAKNAVFDITIPEGYALELHTVEFLTGAGQNQLANRFQYFLVDDVDEDANPGHTAEKVIVSSVWTASFLTSGKTNFWQHIGLYAHKTLLVNPPNFIVDQTVDADANITHYCRIWFDFVKISPNKILELLRQQQY